MVNCLPFLSVIFCLLSCSDSSTFSPQSSIVRVDGSQACYVTGAISIPVILLENVYEGQLTALARDKEGTQRIVDTSWLTEWGTCNE